VIDNVDLVLFGLIATLSPMAFAATLVVIRAGRLRAIAFAIGFLGAQIVTCTTLVLLGGWSLPHHDRAHPTLRALLAIGFGLWVLSLARRFRRSSEIPEAVTPKAGTPAVLERVGRLRSATTLLAGIVLGVGGPKRLVVTALAAAAIASSGSGDTTNAALVALYSIVATLVVWLPVLAFMLVGERAIATIDDTVRWIAQRRRIAMFYALVALGAGAIASGLAGLN
jgi:hypothetical protein